MSQFQSFLSRLDAVKPVGPDRWRAHCPAHQTPPHRAGRGRTLSIALGGDGQTLIHCHAGCSCEEVVVAAGLTLADLFPARGAGHGHFSRGNGGPASWAGAAGAADALGDAAIDFATGAASVSVFRILELTEAFKRAARQAMRSDAALRKGVSHGG